MSEYESDKNKCYPSQGPYEIQFLAKLFVINGAIKKMSLKKLTCLPNNMHTKIPRWP